jgi:folate-binding Fe-S cluster repair protein YgfZ
VGGLNFQKGCYPGQEIVARMQYLGRLKERLQRFHVDADAAAAGDRIFGGSFGDQACGTVVNAASAPEGGIDLLAVVQWTALDSGQLHLGSLDGPLLTPRALPYSVPEPVQPTRPQL